MQLALRERLLPVFVLGSIAALLPAGLEAAIGRVRVDPTAQVHFYSVGLTALTAAVAAIVLTVAGARRSDTRTVLVGSAFAVMAALLALHGFSTPGLLVGGNGVIALTGGLTLPVGGAMLALSVLPLPVPLRNVRVLLALQAALLIAVLALGVSAILFPQLVPAVPAANSPVALALLAVGVAVYGLVAARAFRTFLLTRRWLDLAVLVGLVWLLTALVAALTMGWYDLGWWMGHEFELDGILLIGAAVALDLTRATQSRPLAGDLRAAELVAAEELFLGSHVRALTKRLAEKDAYTEQHARRVALLAVQVGELLNLPSHRLRLLAIGGLVHDIGKLSVPDTILKKPAALTDDEYELIKNHPDWGDRLLKQLGGFPEPVRRLVRDHHERLDGTGYPRGLKAEQLDLDTRILTVCDVYDALITPRVYRPAWTQDKAINLLRSEAGTAFDPRCVTALEHSLLHQSIQTETHARAGEAIRAHATRRALKLRTR
jgi:HD-GYP domain-containing protein (c-di-GMP phosphodiesterase class II)